MLKCFIILDATVPNLLSIAGLLKQLLKYGYFVSVIMSNTGKDTDSSSPELFEGESPLPLMLKKVQLVAVRSYLGCFIACQGFLNFSGKKKLPRRL